MDEARKRGIYINVQTLSEKIGAPVIPTIAHMGKGISTLFETVLDVAHEKSCPLPQLPARHILAALQPLNAVIARPEIEEVFGTPRALLLSQLAENDDYFLRTLTARFPGYTTKSPKRVPQPHNPCRDRSPRSFTRTATTRRDAPRSGQQPAQPGIRRRPATLARRTVSPPLPGPAWQPCWFSPRSC